MTFEEIEDKERYFIQPYVEGAYCRINIIEKGKVVSITAVNEDGEKVNLDNKIKKELSKTYRTSKFFRFPTVLEGVISVDKQNRYYLILFDIMTEDEFEGKSQSKRYDIRYQNLVFRFLSKMNKYVKALFTHPYNDISINLVIEQFIKTDSLNKIMFRKNIPKGYEENEFIEYKIWTEFRGKILGYEVGHDVKKEFDEKQNLVSETPFEYLKAFKVFNEKENETILVKLTNFTEAQKVNMLKCADDFINKKLKFKKYNFLNNVGYIFVNDGNDYI